MAENKSGAYGTKAADTDFRRKWDKEEYAEKARQKDEEERLRMQENEERMKQGTSPRPIHSLTSPFTYPLPCAGTKILTPWLLSHRKEAHQGEEERSPEAY
jgi:hypothetical protein